MGYGPLCWKDRGFLTETQDFGVLWYPLSRVMFMKLEEACEGL